MPTYIHTCIQLYIRTRYIQVYRLPKECWAFLDPPFVHARVSQVMKGAPITLFTFFPSRKKVLPFPSRRIVLFFSITAASAATKKDVFIFCWLVKGEKIFNHRDVRMHDTATFCTNWPAKVLHSIFDVHWTLKLSGWLHKEKKVVHLIKFTTCPGPSEPNFKFSKAFSSF